MNSLILKLLLLTILLFERHEAQEWCIATPDYPFASFVGHATYNLLVVQADRSECQNECFNNGRAFSAVWKALYCFCADDVSTTTNATITTCTTEDGMYVMRSAPGDIAVVNNINPGSGVFPGLFTMTPTLILLAPTSTIHYQYSYRDRDNRWEVSTDMTPIQRTISYPGVYEIRSQAIKPSSMRLISEASTQFLVTASIANLNFTCPTYGVVYIIVICTLTMSSGSSLSGTITVNSGTQETVLLTDFSNERAGSVPSFFVNNLVSGSTAAGIHVAGAMFQYPGTVAYIELTGKAVATVNLLLLKPNCPNYYCFSNSQCATNVACGSRLSCAISYCSISRSCSNSCNNRLLNRENVTSLLVDYTIIQSYPYTISTTGYQRVQLPTVWTVDSGYRLGFHSQTTSDVIAALAIRSGETNDFYFNSHTVTVNTNLAAASLTNNYVTHQISAVSVPTILYNLRFVFNTTGQMEIQLTLNSNSLNPVTASKSVTIGLNINDTNFMPPFVASTNESTTIQLLPLTGIYLQFFWNFGDGHITNTSTPYVNHTFSTHGTFNVSVIGYNLVVSRNQSVLYIVSDKVVMTSFTGTATTTPNTVVNFQLVIASGDNYQCTLSGDSFTNVTQPSTNLKFTGSWPNTGYYNLVMSCYNALSKASLSFTQIVMTPITGLTFKILGGPINVETPIHFTWTTGSNISFQFLFDNITKNTFKNEAAFTGYSENVLVSTISTKIAVLRAINPMTEIILVANLVFSEPITGLKITPLTPYVQLNTEATFKVTIDTGSSVMISINFDDSTMPISYTGPNMTRWTTPYSSTHKFNVTKAYNVTVTANNTASIVTASTIMYVITGLGTYTVAASKQYLKIGETVQVSLTRTSGVVASMANLSINWMDSSSSFVSYTTFNETTLHDHSFTAIGAYNINVTLTNPINAVTYSTLVYVLNSIANFRCSNSPLNTWNGNPMSFKSLIDSGDYVHIVFIPGDSGTNQQTNISALAPSTSHVFTHTYNTVGNYTANITACNQLGCASSCLLNIQIQYKIIRSDFQVTTNGFVINLEQLSTITATFSGTLYPTSMTATFNYPDGSTPIVASLHSANTPFTQSKNLSATGYLNVSITLSNLVSSEVYYIQVGAFDKFSGFGVTTTWGPSRSAGLGLSNLIFPYKQTVFFAPSKGGKGTVTSYTFMYVPIKNPNNVYSCNATIVDGAFGYIFPSVGDYNVSFIAINPVDKTFVNLAITIGGSMRGGEIIPPLYTLFPNYYGFVTLVWTVITPTACICVDLGNGTKVIYGATFGCTNCSSKTYMNVQPQNNQIQMTVKYPLAGDYNIIVYVYDSIASSIMNRTIPITSVRCATPLVSMTTVAFMNTDTPQVGMRGSQITVSAMILDLPCVVTNNNFKSWTAMMMDPLYFTPIKPIDLSTIFTSNNTQLILPPLFLSYGLYQLTFTVIMDKNITKYTFQNYSSTYLNVVQSPIIVALSAGGITQLVKGLHEKICLTPTKYSRDPDLTVQNFNNWVWTWTCSQSKESVNFSHYVVPKSKDYSFPTIKTGCFGDGPGIVNFTVDPCFDGVNFNENILYEFNLNGTSGDGRKGRAKITIEAVNGIPPTITIQCMRSQICSIKEDGPHAYSEVAFNPSDALIVNASCKNSDGKICATGIWSLLYQNGTDPVFTLLSHSDTLTFLKGYQSQQMAILPSFFTKYPSLSRFQTCYSTEGLQPDGKACFQFFINPLPKDVICTVNGTTISQTDVLCCNCTYTPGYNYLIYVNANDQLTTLGFSTIGYFCSIIPYQTMNQTYFVRVTNKFGGYVEYNISQIHIKTLSDNSLQQIINGLLNGSDSSLQMVNAKGDLKTMSQVYLKYVSVLTVSVQNMMQGIFGSATNNSKMSLGGSGYTQTNIVKGGMTIDDLPPAKRKIYETNRDSMSGVVNLMTSNLVNMVPADIQSLHLVTSVVASVTNSVDLLNRQAQNDVSVKLAKLALNLKTMQGTASRNDIQTVASSLLTATFQCDTAVNSQIKNGIQRDIKQSKENFLDYDTNIDSTKDSFMNVDDPSAAANLLVSETNSDFQSDVSTIFGANSAFTISTVTKVLRGISVLDDTPVELNSGTMQYFHQKSLISNLNGSSFVKGRSAIKMPDVCAALGGKDCNKPNNAVTIEIMATPSNVKVALPNSNGKGLPIPTETDTISLNLYTGSNDDEKSVKVNSSQEFKITLARDPSFQIANFTDSDPNIKKPQIAEPQIIPGTGSPLTGPLYYQQKLVMHQFRLNGTDQSVHFQMKFNVTQNCTQFLVVGRLLEPPSLSISPDGTHDPDGGFLYWGMIPTHTKFCTSEATKNDPDPFTFYIDNHKFTKAKLNITATQPYYLKNLNVVYFGVRELRNDEWNNYTDKNKPPYPYPHSDQINTTYQVRIYSTGCYSNSDNFKSAWKTTGCKVGSLTTPIKTECICTHLTTFISGFVVAPNTIDFNYVFSNFDMSKNQTLFVTEGVICLIFILLMVWARRKDIKDLEKIGVTPLADNDTSDMYLYEIIVDTSIRNGAGTKSKVYFILSGEKDETEARHIYDANRIILQRGNIDRFLLAVPRTLGPLQYIRLWHDNSGKGPNASWYCNYFGVTDLQTKEKFHFLVNRWFAVEEDDGQVDRLIAVASTEEMLLFGELFGRKMKHDLTENHLWLSIMARPPESRFTRVERVACCMLLMFLTMLTTCMFYQQDGPSKVTDNALVIGPLAITPREVWVGLISGIIGFVPLFIVIDLFRKSQLKHGHANKLREVVEDHLQISIVAGHDNGATSSAANLVHNEEIDTERPYTPGYRAPDQIEIEVADANHDEKKSVVDQDSEKKVVRQKLFPWWVRIISWIILVVVLIVAFFFTTLYGIQFGDMACKKWISSMFISFFASVLLIQPVKVVVLAIVFSLLCKNSSAFNDDFIDEEDELMNELGKRNGLMADEEYLHEDLYTAPMKPHRRLVQPPSKDDIEKARELRLKELKMYDVIREILFYLIFFTTLLLVTYSFRDPNAYNLKTELESVFVTPWNQDWQFAGIRREDQFWQWALNVLVPALRAPLWYNNNPQIYQRGFLSDRSNRLMGYAVMRQVRVKNNTCTVYSYVENLVKKCYGSYEIWNEDKANYDIGWTITNKTAASFTYNTSDQLSGIPYLGEMNVYSGGGYVYQFRSDVTKLYTEVANLRDNRWIDFRTRAILIQFTTYNPNINLFAICTFLLEMPGTGGMWPSYRIEPANLLGVYSSQVTAFEIFCQALYGVFIVMMIVKEIRSLMKQKSAYFKQFWNWIDIFLIGGSFACVAAFVYIRYGTGKLTEQFSQTSGDAYMNFQFVGFWNEYMGYLTSFIVFAATLKFIKLLRFNRRIGMLGAVLSYCSKDMRQFFIIFMIMFLAFVMVFYCLFMDSLSRYHTFLYSMESSMQIALGKFSFLELYQREPIFGPIVFAFYVIFIIFIMLNMFIAILTEGFDIVRSDIELQGNEFEIMDFIMTKFILLTGITNTRIGQKLIKTNVTDQMYKEIDERELMAKVNSFPDKVDQLLNHINHIVGTGDLTKSSHKGFSNVVCHNPSVPAMECHDKENGYNDGQSSRPATASSNILRPRSGRGMTPIEK